jgi:hypothetical protein
LSGIACQKLPDKTVTTRAIVRPAPLGNDRPMAASVQMRALQKAVEITGGRRALTARLGVKAADIEKWMSGKAEVPRDVFVRVVELIIDELTPDADASEAGEPPAPRSSAAWSPRDCD